MSSLYAKRASPRKNRREKGFLWIATCDSQSLLKVGGQTHSKSKHARGGPKLLGTRDDQIITKSISIETFFKQSTGRRRSGNSFEIVTTFGCFRHCETLVVSKQCGKHYLPKAEKQLEKWAGSFSFKFEELFFLRSVLPFKFSTKKYSAISFRLKLLAEFIRLARFFSYWKLLIAKCKNQLKSSLENHFK